MTHFVSALLLFSHGEALKKPELIRMPYGVNRKHKRGFRKEFIARAKQQGLIKSQVMVLLHTGGVTIYQTG